MLITAEHMPETTVYRWHCSRCKQTQVKPSATREGALRALKSHWRTCPPEDQA